VGCVTTSGEAVVVSNKKKATTEFTETATELTRRIVCVRPWLFP